MLLYGVLQWPFVVVFSTQSILEMASDKDSVKVELGSPIFRAATIDIIEGVTLPPPPHLTPAQESKLWRKMDLRLLPILAFIYLMAFMDRGDLLFFGFEYLNSC